MDYEDFVVEIAPNWDHGYTVRVLKSPAGTGESPLSLTRFLDDQETLLAHLGQAIRGRTVSGHRHVRDLRVATSQSPQEVGAELFRALFTENVKSLFDQSLGAIEKTDRGLRITLKLNPRHPEPTRIFSLPWELLYRTDTEDYLSFSRLTPVVRALDVSRAPRSTTFPSPLNVLVVASNPNKLQPLALEREQRNLEKALAGRNDIELTVLEKANPRSLRDSLLKKPFHVVHFMGHGGFDPETGEGSLYFECEDLNPILLRGQDLANRIKDFKSIRLVLLNACNTARLVGKDGINPFAGVAAACVLAGIPSVIAMQFPISDEASIAFSRKFYQRIVANDKVDAAVAEGRHAIDYASQGTTEWATPVLFMQAIEEPQVRRPGDLKATTSSKTLRARSFALASTLVLTATLLWAWHKHLKNPNTPTLTIISQVTYSEIHRTFSNNKPASIQIQRVDTQTPQTFQLPFKDSTTKLKLNPGQYTAYASQPDTIVTPKYFQVTNDQEMPIRIIAKKVGSTLQINTPLEFNDPVNIESPDASHRLLWRSPGVATIEGIPTGQYRVKSAESDLFYSLERHVAIKGGASPYILDFSPRPKSRRKEPAEHHRAQRNSGKNQKETTKRQLSPGLSQANYLMLVRAVRIACKDDAQSLMPAIRLISGNIDGTGHMPVLSEEKQKLKSLLGELMSGGCVRFQKWSESQE